MREKLNSLPLAQLREIAKANGLKGISSLKKAELIDRLMVMAEEQIEAKEAEEKARRSREREEAKAETAKPEQQNNSEPGKETAKQGNAAPNKPGKNHSARKTGGFQEADEKGRRNQNQNLSRRNKPQKNRTAVKDKKNADAGTDASKPETAEIRTIESPAENISAAGPEAAEETRTAAVKSENPSPEKTVSSDPAETSAQQPKEDRLDSGVVANGILEVMADGFGFIRSDNYMPGENDIYVAPSQIKKFGLRTGDILTGRVRVKTQNEKFSALLRLERVNGFLPSEVQGRRNFEDLTPVFPDERLKLERLGEKNMAMRVVDIISPIGKGQRGMIVSPPKAGKTTLLKGVAHSILKNNPEVHIMILLIDERPEEVTDIKEDITGDNVDVIYSTFDELPEHHKRVSEMVIERAKRLVEMKQDVVILLDSITRLARAYNLLVPPSGRTLSGGLDPAALYMPKRFFGAARNIREGGSLTILATALVDTGSKMDDVVYEEFKGTGNMELILDRKLQEKRVFPAIDISKSGTRRDDLLLSLPEQDAAYIIHKAIGGTRAEESTEKILDLFTRTRTNAEFVDKIRINKYI